MLSSWQRRARAQNDFETSQSDAFAAPGFRLALGIFGLAVESGSKWHRRFEAGDRRTPTIIVLTGYEGKVVTDAIQQTGVFVQHLLRQVIPAAAKGKRFNHLVGDETRHLAPFPSCCQFAESVCHCTPPVQVKDRPVRRGAGIERYLLANLGLVNRRLFRIVGGNYEDAATQLYVFALRVALG